MTIRRIALFALMAAASPLAVAGTAHADTMTDSPVAAKAARMRGIGVSLPCGRQLTVPSVVPLASLTPA